MSIEDIGHILWTVETDITPGGAQALTGVSGWGQGGRLGTELTTGHTDALRAIKVLRAEASGKAWMSPARSRGTREAAEAGLALIKAARAVELEAMHAALEEGMTPTEIAERAGCSRQTVYNKIDRHSIAAIVKGE